MSMGNAAGLKAWQVLANCERALAIELLAGAQARRVPRAARAGRRRARRRAAAVRELSPRLRDDRSLAPDIEAVAIGDPRRLARRGGGGGGGRAAMSTTETLAGRVEALCGDLSHIRAPHGTELNARQWSTEAPLRMLLEQSRRGGRGEAGGADRLRRLRQRGALARGAARDRRRAARARRGRDAARAVGQAGRRLHDARGRAARADRELAARAEVGDVGRVPPARGGGPDDVRPDDGGLVDLHRHAGDPAGHVPDVRRGGREALRLAGSARARRSSPPGSAAWAARSRSRGRWRAPRSSASRSIRIGSSGGSRRATSTRRRTRSTTRSRACARRRRRAARSRSGCSGTRRRSCRRSPRAASTSTSSPTRPRRTIR